MSISNQNKLKFVLLLVTSFFLVQIFTVPIALASRNHPRNQLNYFDSYGITNKTKEAWHIEIGLNHSSVPYEVTQEGSRTISITLENTSKGKLADKISQNSALVSDLIIQEDKEKKTVQILIHLKKDIMGPCYQVTTADPERRKGKPYRLIIDVYPPDKGYAGTTLVDGVRNHTIVLDAGHGGSDTGAVGPQGITEASVTLSLTKKLQKILEASGAHIAMTRTTDVDVYGPYATDQQELQARVDVGSRTPGTEVFLCIHCNAFSNPNARGMETYFYPKTAQDERLATDLHDALIQAESPYGIPDRGVKEARFYVMRHSVMPASLVEIAFITNPAEEQLLNDGKFQEDIALGLAKGLAKFFQDNKNCRMV